MTLLAGGGETQLNVINWRSRGVVVLLVTADTRRVGAGQAVVVVNVTLRALRAGQVESG